MSTVPTPRVPTKPSPTGPDTTPKPGKVNPPCADSTLVLTIGSSSYSVIRLKPDAAVASAAFRLVKLIDAVVYDIAVTGHGVACSCPDFTFNRDGKDAAGCKHICCLRAWGLVPAA